MPAPFLRNVINEDLSSRLVQTNTVSASPAAGAETIIGTLVIPDFNNIPLAFGVKLEGYCAVTIGTSGVSATLRIRQTNVAGTVIVSSGALTVVAGNLVAPSVMGSDALPGVGTYVLTLAIGSGAATSTVSALTLAATCI